MSCFCVCQYKNKVKAESTGWRATFYYPGGGLYRGYWLKSQNHNYGVKEDKNGLIYDGQWQHGKRHGHGTMRKVMPNGQMERIYIGEWRDDKKCGEGKQYFPDGIYYGWWKDNRRDGLGMMWYNDKRFYMGEWRADVYHGVGVLFSPNNNRYEGHFARGMKNGEGTFFHIHTGQVQKGMWNDDVCKTCIFQDFERNQGDQPTPYPLPQCDLANPNLFVCALFRELMGNANKPEKSFHELLTLKFVQKMRKYVKLEPKHNSNLMTPIGDLLYPCVCLKSNENWIYSKAREEMKI